MDMSKRTKEFLTAVQEITETEPKARAESNTRQWNVPDSRHRVLFTFCIRRLLLYNASIKPLVTYCCTVRSTRSQNNLDELCKLQKHCARSILDSPRDARSFDNFQKMKWPPIDQIFKLNKLGRLKKVIGGRLLEWGGIISQCSLHQAKWGGWF